MVPPVGGASRNRETMFRRQMVPLARFVKQINIFCSAGQAGHDPSDIAEAGQPRGDRGDEKFL
jgi:hypothetical protein